MVSSSVLDFLPVWESGSEIILQEGNVLGGIWDFYYLLVGLGRDRKKKWVLHFLRCFFF